MFDIAAEAKKLVAAYDAKYRRVNQDDVLPLDFTMKSVEIVEELHRFLGKRPKGRYEFAHLLYATLDDVGYGPDDLTDDNVDEASDEFDKAVVGIAGRIFWVVPPTDPKAKEVEITGVVFSDP
jgi:hypothetical protein